MSGLPPQVERSGVPSGDGREKLYYTVSGTGSPLVALHGFGATSYAWRYVAPALARDHEVYLVDLKGHGASPRPANASYSLETQAGLVYDLIRDHNLRNLTLVGNSLGGGVALTLAMRMAREGDTRLAALVLLDSIYKAPVPLIFRILRSRTWGRVAMSLPPRMSVLFTLWHVTASLDAITTDAVDAYAVNLSEPGGKEALLETIRQIDLEGIDDTIVEIRRLDVRALILWGRDDPYFGLPVAERLHRDLRNSRYYVIDKCGHLPQEEKPDIVISWMREFLSGNEMATSS